jgi:tRNA N6-adenosine threonylcarbamoyltransferase
MSTFVTLGVETSCDETAAAVYAEERLLSNIIFSQINLHKLYGGVVPEIASRSHIEKINTITTAALNEANVSLKDIDNIAVTYKPGLPGSLLVGVCFAKALAWASRKQLIGVNHLEGHAFSAHIEHQIPFPYLCLTASGGHTSLYLIKNFGDYTLLGTTTDDAAGEAFDKIAKLMGLPYPGGPVIEQLARMVDFKDFFHYPRLKTANLTFSFSGLKTAVLYDLVAKNVYDLTSKEFLASDNEELKCMVASSLLVCVADISLQRLKLAYKLHPYVKAISFVGGVACNKFISRRLQDFATEHNLSFFTPSPSLCTDNAGMIAYVGNYKAQQGLFSDLTLDIY